MNINEKLSLKKKTVVVLNESQMRAIRGGGQSLSDCDNTGYCVTAACATNKCDKGSAQCAYTVVTCQ